MLIRIVKMSFEPSKIQEFLMNFDANKRQIRAFEGCEFLELYRDKNNKDLFFTYSYWQTEADLEHYRHSELFKKVWSKTKPLFNAKPEAWSVNRLHSLN
ncbi:antibiotic biosynthesis monooxygenase [Subsaximicrobium wynnwilliamsii]|uniref:Antibiotic biosynthesis monooxygenase n=1 Tax=Subsaximicrobium wynnwilliamsii TaxID=291179 RepID=A0A5C6ZMC6_9FLAO|nr:antibiotic biosynthesis monooxygenase family protein [Subsaximicrobium wynnwilliamsii]TXD85183.1 antibiotic biosynthesis monooxygenase [Subsaximicrobium wynnwilliamsii]TXD91226.1 antibiotic biosynthesis monooxygenase [Subsaximicrobium wynnwilliamsii]TXE04619.1 antibiotic biosynthesis monooxygenase [Subsaximicrobium wynnwilliamsii]